MVATTPCGSASCQLPISMRDRAPLLRRRPRVQPSPSKEKVSQRMNIGNKQGGIAAIHGRSMRRWPKTSSHTLAALKHGRITELIKNQFTLGVWNTVLTNPFRGLYIRSHSNIEDLGRPHGFHLLRSLLGKCVSLVLFGLPLTYPSPNTTP